MNNSLLKAFTNWSHVGGCSFLQSVQERPANPDSFVKPQLNDLVNEEKSILLSKEDSSEYCELYLNLSTNFKIQAVSLVCNVAKIEIFQGPIKEYLETIYGTIVDESDDQFKSYRYDVEIEKSGITELTLRFLTDSSDVCIFGVILHTAPNPNGITTLLPNTNCENLKNIEKILQRSTRQPPINFVDELGKLVDIATQSNKLNLLTTDQHTKEEEKSNDVYDLLKSHIDECFQKMEERLNKYLEDMEQRQNLKLDTILNILKNTNK